jgi:D-alanine--poly(phosphoribitol) ligase subunit 2
MPIPEKILAVLADVTENDEVLWDLDIALYDRHILDSLKTVELILAFQEEFGVETPLAAFEPDQWATPRKIVAYVQCEAGSERAIG